MLKYYTFCFHVIEWVSGIKTRTPLSYSSRDQPPTKANVVPLLAPSDGYVNREDNIMNTQSIYTVINSFATRVCFT